MRLHTKLVLPLFCHSGEIKMGVNDETLDLVGRLAMAAPAEGIAS
jgi:hypothetical protein